VDLGLQGKIALVAAASRGLGRAVAEELAREGARLVIAARTEGPLRETQRALEDLSGHSVLAMPTDLSDPEATVRLVRRGIDEFGRIDVLVTNAGGPPAGPFESHAPEVWNTSIAQNFQSVLNLTREVLPGMKERRWGRIVNITSIAVKQPVDNLIISNSVRAAVTGFARTLANEVASFGITVNNVLPGYTRTQRVEELAERAAAVDGLGPEAIMERWESQIPARRIGEPSEFAAAVAFLASERASYITGVSLPVDGGWIKALY
jgi:3-oxoacyl-[acyl-carrier protein] reductase